MMDTTTSAGPARARTALSCMIGDLPPIGLDQVMSAARLQTRVDHKYLLTPEQLTEMVGLTGGLSALEIDGRRLFSYESVYFDTPDLASFRAHKQGQRRRYKIRTRTYLDSCETMLEVKLKGHRGRTDKHRTTHPVLERDALDEEARTFVDAVLREENMQAPPPLRPALRTTYSRATLVDAQAGTRLTCDVDLVFAAADTEVPGPYLVLVESKSGSGSAAADRVLRSMGVRPISMSKYCIGTALVRPHLAANPWNRLLQQSFGWSRQR